MPKYFKKCYSQKCQRISKYLPKIFQILQTFLELKCCALQQHACTRFLIKCINFILTKINLCYFAHFCKCNFLRPATLAFGRPRDDGTRRAPKMQLFSTNCDDSNGDPDVDDRCAFDSARETALYPSSCQNQGKVGG